MSNGPCWSYCNFWVCQMREFPESKIPSGLALKIEGALLQRYFSIMWTDSLPGHLQKVTNLLFGFVFPYIGNHHPNWLLFFREVGIPPTRSHPSNTIQHHSVIANCYVTVYQMVIYMMFTISTQPGVGKSLAGSEVARTMLLLPAVFCSQLVTCFQRLKQQSMATTQEPI